MIKKITTFTFSIFLFSLVESYAFVRLDVYVIDLQKRTALATFIPQPGNVQGNIQITNGLGNTTLQNPARTSPSPESFVFNINGQNIACGPVDLVDNLTSPLVLLELTINPNNSCKVSMTKYQNEQRKRR